MNGKRITTGPTASAARADHDWQDAASCRTSGDHPDLWHLPQAEHIRDAKEVCRECPVKSQCLAQALADPTLTGVWGGTTDDERKALRGPQPTGWRHGTNYGHKQHRALGEDSCADCWAAARRSNAAGKRTRRKSDDQKASA